MSNKLISLQKQNDSIYSSLESRNIIFERTIIPDNLDEDEHLKLLNEENNKLKECVKNNKPPPQPKKEKQEPPKKKEEMIDKDDDENYEEPIKKFDTITNMEDIKRAFFNGDYNFFESQLKELPFKFLRAKYKYNSDKDSAPVFSAKNLLGGFVRNFDNYRKYFMICFRCWMYDEEITRYEYDSLWIVNTNEPINNIIGNEYYEYFDFEEIDNLDKFFKDLKKIDDNENTKCFNE